MSKGFQCILVKFHLYFGQHADVEIPDAVKQHLTNETCVVVINGTVKAKENLHKKFAACDEKEAVKSDKVTISINGEPAKHINIGRGKNKVNLAIYLFFCFS